MAKKQSFADKASKRKDIKVCPVCNSDIALIKLMRAVKRNGNWKFASKPFGVCKCNEAEIYG